jgi:HD-GYP domain-containing protein (c-di-GMP phosphodiesterase class II)
MAADVGLAQALTYARDLKSLYEAGRVRERALESANARLRAAHAQALRYAQDLQQTHRRLETCFLHSLLALANALEARDPYTRGHSERVAGWARLLARASGLAGDAAEMVAQAGRLHDLGKIGVPEAVLRKPGPLTEDELRHMRRHPLTGAQILAPLDFFAAGAAIVRHHHERLDGSGYPDGLAAGAIPLGARIVAVADVFDALTSDRPYRAAMSIAEAVRAIEAEAGRTLDADVVARFFALLADGAIAREL